MLIKLQAHFHHPTWNLTPDTYNTDEVFVRMEESTNGLIDRLSRV